MTSDKRVARAAGQAGSKVTSCPDFLEKLRRELPRRPRESEEPVEKYYGAPRWEVEYWLKIFGEV